MSCYLTSFIRHIGSMWCGPSTIVLTWIAFFSFVLYWLRKKQARILNSDGSTSNIRQFHDLPSPRGLPFLGNVTQLGDKPHLVLTEWGKKFGPIYRIRMGSKDALVINGLKTIRKANHKQHGDFAGRPPYETSKLICEGNSLTFQNYSAEWMRRKRFAKQAVLLYTTGRDPDKRYVMEESANRHANNLIDELIENASQEDHVVNPEPLVLRNGLNTISELCFGKSFGKDDPELNKFLSINESFDEAMGAAQAVNLWPFLKHVPILSRPYKRLEIYSAAYWKFVVSILENHFDTYNPNHLRDIIDCLKFACDKACEKSKKINNNENTMSNGVNGHTRNGSTCQQNGCSPSNDDLTDDVDPGYNLQQRICYTGGDVFGAGYDTVHTAITWATFYMAAFPETQEKLRDEVIAAMSPDESPSLRLHRSRTPYIQAWIYELLRHVAIVPLLLPHYTTRDTELENCRIPAGVLVIINAYQTTRDPELWEEPEEFRPERFLQGNEEDGYELCGDAVSNLIVWGTGPRRCPGTDLSRNQMFIFVSNLVRRCNIEQSRPGVEPAFPWPITFGLTIKPTGFKVKVTAR